MNKTSIKGPGEFLGFLAQLYNAVEESALNLEIPDEYPVIAVWTVIEPRDLELEYVYMEDFT